MTQAEIRVIVDRAYRLIEENPDQYQHLLKALQQEDGFRKATASDLDTLSSELAKKISSSEEDTDDVKARILKRMGTDSNLIDQLNKLPPSYRGDKDIAWSIKTNKMQIALGVGQEEGADPFIRNKFDALLSSIENETYVSGYDYSYRPDQFTQTDRQDRPFYGSSKNTFYKTALFNTSLEYNHLKKLDQINSSTQWIDHTPSAHIAPLPETVIQKLPALEQSTYVSKNYDAQTPYGFSYIHSGYAFGGHRFESRYSDKKLWGPEDCSSFIGKLTIQGEVSTTDLLSHHRVRLGQSLSSIIQNTVRYALLLKNIDCLIPVKVKDLQKDIQPGMVWAVRRFKKEGDYFSSEMGVAGHTALIMNEPDSQGKVEVLGYNRDMPHREGFGFESCDLSHQKESIDLSGHRAHLFFKVENKNDSRRRAQRALFPEIK